MNKNLLHSLKNSFASQFDVQFYFLLIIVTLVGKELLLLLCVLWRCWMLCSLLMALPWQLWKGNPTWVQIMLTLPACRFCCVVWFSSQLASWGSTDHWKLGLLLVPMAEICKGRPHTMCLCLGRHRDVWMRMRERCCLGNPDWEFLFWEDAQQGMVALPWEGHCFWSWAVQLVGLD